MIPREIRSPDPKILYPFKIQEPGRLEVSSPSGTQDSEWRHACSVTHTSYARVWTPQPRSSKRDVESSTPGGAKQPGCRVPRKPWPSPHPSLRRCMGCQHRLCVCQHLVQRLQQNAVRRAIAKATGGRCATRGPQEGERTQSCAPCSALPRPCT